MIGHRWTQPSPLGMVDVFHQDLEPDCWAKWLLATFINCAWHSEESDVTGRTKISMIVAANQNVNESSWEAKTYSP